jgi:hypothetical protein|tara:strand:- start:2 stop:295 length:294 start_codon:yes stop_codon:yes gene_type:complete
MARYKMVGNNRIELTSDELAELNVRETAWSNGALDRALNKLREERNQLLVETDWMANSDVTMSDDWKTYRQALRDITSGLDTVAKVNEKEFPTKPGA